MEPRYFVREDAGTCFVRGRTEAIYDTQGRLISPAKPALKADFKRGAPGWALKQVQHRFQWGRMPPGYTPQAWVAWYDSGAGQTKYGYTDEERALIEDALGGFPGVVEVEIPRVQSPYKKYLAHRKLGGKRTLDHVLNDIASAIDSAGVDPQAVIDYEHDHRDDLSDRIIEAVSRLRDVVEDEEVVEA